MKPKEELRADKYTTVLQVFSLAYRLVERLIKRVDARILVPPFCNLAEHGNPRLKVSLLNIMAKTNLLDNLNVNKPATILK